MSELVQFLPAILGGLVSSKQADVAFQKVDGWISQSLHLDKIARFLGNREHLDADRVSKLLSVCIKSENTPAVLEVIQTCLGVGVKDQTIIRKKIFFECIKFLTKRRDASWVEYGWINVDKSKVFDHLLDDEICEIFSNLIYRCEINFRDEILLAKIAKSNPESVLQYFGNRFKYEEIDGTKEDRSNLERFEAIPYDFNKLDKVLSPYPELVLRYAVRWFDDFKPSFRFRGGRFVKIIFSQIPPEFTDQLILLIHSGNQDHINMIISILKNYKGEVALHPVFLELVLANDEQNEKQREMIMVVLEGTGVVRGEYGFADSYKRKIEEIKCWLKDENEKIRKFGRDYIDGLRMQITQETRRSDLRIAMRKREYGEDNSKD